MPLTFPALILSFFFLKNFFLNIFLEDVFMFILLACTYVYLVHAWCPWRLEGIDSLELQLRMLVNHHVGAGNVTHVLCKSNKCS